MTTEELNNKLDILIDGVRDNKLECVTELLSMFKPTIYKISNIIHDRYCNLISMDDLISECSQLFLYLTAIEYKKEGEEGFRAHFPRFIQVQLHARMVQMCRPTATYRKKVVDIKDIFQDGKLPSDHLENIEMKRLIDKVNHFMQKTFNEREKDIITNHVILGHSRADIATKYHISIMRMKTIHKRCINKLKLFLHKQHVDSLEDI